VYFRKRVNAKMAIAISSKSHPNERNSEATIASGEVALIKKSPIKSKAAKTKATIEAFVILSKILLCVLDKFVVLITIPCKVKSMGES